MSISQDLLSTPEHVELIRQIHHIAAIVLAPVGYLPSRTHHLPDEPTAACRATCLPTMAGRARRRAHAPIPAVPAQGQAEVRAL
ncbi:MAG: hypothetical protein MZV49_25405 [Rhodopseudomonas palustris]|nr:hypothetical protein [Rhodopseudomonas palustris]